MKKFLFSLITRIENPKECIETAVKIGNIEILRFYYLYETEIKEKRKQSSMKETELFDFQYLTILAINNEQKEIVEWIRKIYETRK